MTIDLREVREAVKRATASVREELPPHVTMQSDVYLVLDFEDGVPYWSTRFTYRHRRRVSHQTYHGPAATTPIEALDALLDDIVSAEVIP